MVWVTKAFCHGLVSVDDRKGMTGIYTLGWNRALCVLNRIPLFFLRPYA